MTKHPYETQEERQAILDDNPGKVIVLEANHFDASYLMLDSPRAFDLSTKELKALVLVLLDELNELRSIAQLPEHSLQEFKQLVKAKLNIGG